MLVSVFLMGLTPELVAGPLDAALTATEAPKTFRAAFVVEMTSEQAMRRYAYDPRLAGDLRWQELERRGIDDELDAAGAEWAGEIAPDGRLLPDDLRESFGASVTVEDLGAAWRLNFRHTPSRNDGELDIWAAQNLKATAWLDQIGERFIRIDYHLPGSVALPGGGRLIHYDQSYELRTEPTWGLSYVSRFTIELEARAVVHREHRQYTADITHIEFFFANKAAQRTFEQGRQPVPEFAVETAPTEALSSTYTRPLGGYIGAN